MPLSRVSDKVCVIEFLRIISFQLLKWNCTYILISCQYSSKSGIFNVKLSRKHVSGVELNWKHDFPLFFDHHWKST